MVPDTTPMPKKSATFSPPSRCAARGTYHSMTTSSVACTGTQSRVMARCQVRREASVWGSGLSVFRPVSASISVNSHHVDSGSNATVQPPCTMPRTASGGRHSDSQNGRA